MTNGRQSTSIPTSGHRRTPNFHDDDDDDNDGGGGGGGGGDDDDDDNDGDGRPRGRRGSLTPRGNESS